MNLAGAGAFMPLFREAVFGPCFSTGNTSHSPRVPTAYGGRDAGPVDRGRSKTRAKEAVRLLSCYF